ncbi:(1-_4)-alpha-D-glucan 1-alpha-D-glucosylmutase [Nitrosomonas sp. Nm51]|uniref:malto-oligosyltrehalose synthase n=1 Tax=Nitrosomonas sp. Nm51 TaxID=133720 RepID=UPI0008AC075D|nr:malto-oligosyltrehalose synthase [Nitrosomonas sp. Nm51]SER17741.1 (1->4)-alpha-D-glucan 1-alpha-D-glucosylmutase [Nitrosomonas sp. Nm51]
MNPSSMPSATYRLQFNHAFTFADAADMIAYLHTLGISHVYASPFLKARAGSLHGYNIVDHNALNPEIGTEAEYNAYIERLHHYGMGQIVDIVPNHMGVGGDDNSWWLDVLENGQSSVYAAYFDIDWHPANPALHNKILLPFLGDHYGSVLESGELKLEFDSENGVFNVRYYEHLFPIDPRTYPHILNLHLDQLAQQDDKDQRLFEALTVVIAACKSLPARSDLSASLRQYRRQSAQACKRHLADLYAKHPQAHGFIQANLAEFNGDVAQSGSFDRLHHLLEAQAYRLSYWKVATEEINYRRFFDINELAALRMENNEVFDVTHQLIRQMMRDGQINGLRIDHPDGLSDPCAYYHHLQQLIRQETQLEPDTNSKYFGLWIEKILANFEHLPSDWPVSGTTGYEAAFQLNGVFVRQQSERHINRIYTRFIGMSLGFEGLLHDRKKLITLRMLSSELSVLANLLSHIAQTDRRTRDFTYQALRDALGEIVACFPVYRTYITALQISEEDLRYVQWAIAQAKKHSPAADILILDFIGQLLTLAHLNEYSAGVRRSIIQFVLKFQQYTAPVMAKGLEDTALYIYNRLASLNDVGFNPCAFGISAAAFHQANKQRLAHWPHAMVATSTHDSKRSEDVRARINVLSEIPDEWHRHLGRWSRLNRNKKRLINHERAPSRNDEYLIYQTLIGAWPLEGNSLFDDGDALESLRQRIEAYTLKAIKEAKVHTSWINPNEDYETAVRYFVGALLSANPEHNAFLADFLPFQQRVARFGLFNSLSQTLLKLTVPGIPDIYQGNELWAFSLVDPDNRRPVDYRQRNQILQTIVRESENSANLPGFTQQLLKHLDNGRAKLYLTWKTLMLRRQNPQLFQHGSYTGLATHGPQADHICAFARCLEGQTIIAAAAREFVPLITEENGLPIGKSVWQDTFIEIPGTLPSPAQVYRNILTGERISRTRIDGQPCLNAAEVFNNFSVGLLVSE